MSGTLNRPRQRPRPATLGHVLALAVVPIALAVVACGAPTPSVDLSRSLHLQSRLNQAVAVEISSRGSDAAPFTTALRPCGGSVVLVPGMSGVPTTELLITLLLDPNGVLDLELSRWSGHPNDLPGEFIGLSILWSSGDIQPANLPRWITVTPEIVFVEETPPAADTTCGRWLQQG